MENACGEDGPAPAPPTLNTAGRVFQRFPRRFCPNAVGYAALDAHAPALPEDPPDAHIPAPPPADSPVVNIYNWNDYFAEDTLERFAAKTGIKPVLDLYDSNELLEAKLLAGHSGYDLVFLRGDRLGAQPTVPVPPTRFGETVDITVEMQAPEAGGTYRGDWRVHKADGDALSKWKRVFVEIEVASGQSTGGEGTGAEP